MAVMRHTAKTDQDGVAVFNDVIPGDYYATINKSIKVAADEQTRAIEIAQFKVAAGEGLTVPCGNNGVTVITGALADKPNPGGIKLNMYVMIERIKRDYVHMPPAGDMLNFDDDGKFQSRPLAPGHYLVRYMAKGMGRGRFGPVGDSAVKTWRVNVDGKSDKIDVAEIQPPSEAGKFVENLLQRALAAPRRGGNYAQQVKSAAFRGGAELMLLRIMSNPEAPYPWRRQIPEMLQSLTDSPRVITGLFDAIKNPVNKR